MASGRCAASGLKFGFISFGASDPTTAAVNCNCFGWLQPWRTGLNGVTHAVEACTSPFRAGRDHPDTRQLTDGITLSEPEGL